MSKFNAAAQGYDLDNATFLAHASDIAYKDKPAVRKIMRSWGFRRCKFISVNNTQLFVAGSNEAVIVSFRGTEKNLADWFNNTKVVLTGGPLGMIHEGFGLALADVWSKLLDAVKDYQDKGQGLWMTGHSLGAALATLATAKYIERATPVRGLYNFGSPRVGNGDFAKNFNAEFREKTFRFVNHHDIVTRVPPRLFLGYRHVGQVYYFDDDGTLEADPNAWSRFVDTLSGTFDHFRKQIGDKAVDAITDHSMTHYIAKLGQQG